MSGEHLHLGLVGPLPPPNGGMAMQTMQLARLLRAEGFDVELEQTNAPYSPKFIGGIIGVRAIFRLVPYLWRVWRLAGRVDVIHLMANSGWSWQLFAAPVIWMGWLRKTPVIVNYRGGEAAEYLAASFSRVRPSLTRVSRLVVPSGFLQQVFDQFCVPSLVIPNIIDLDTFYPASIRVARGFTLVVTRNLEPIYGLDIAIRSVALAREEMPEIQMRIAGSGPLQDELVQLVESLDLVDSVTFLGRLERQAIVDLYHSSDAMLNPARVDNMPNSVLEAMACALPVISTNVGGVPYIVEHERTALLVPPDNVEQMAAAIVRLGRDKTLREKLAENGRQEVAKYSWSEVRQQWLELYRQEVAA